MLKIVADADIPGLIPLLENVGEITSLRGEEIKRLDVRQADVLLVRSVTRVGPALLDGSSVRFVGTATSGIDHVDTDFLEANGIRFESAPGSNAPSVVDYVLAAIVAIAASRVWSLPLLTLGVVGFGNVGSRLANRARQLGLRVLVNDPPQEQISPGFAGGLESVALPDLLSASDVVSLHVPLTGEGPFRTRGLIGMSGLARMKETAVLINTSRGTVVDEDSLMTAVLSDAIGPVVLDVFAGEPEPDRMLIDRVEIATPHIAGYAYDSKLEGGRVIARAVRQFAGMVGTLRVDAGTDPPVGVAAPAFVGKSVEEWANELIERMYDVFADSRRLKSAAARDADLASTFQKLRREYPLRRLFSHHELNCDHIPESHRSIAAALGVTTVFGSG